ncbi:MAG TPA: ABC transporter permease, partial [Gaiellaceae bacterium]|nr:ABC transporter permease [Gaiellaceae bacterium]
RARLDLVLVGLAALGYWQLRRYRTPLVETSGGLSIDPFLVAAPTVLLLAGALLSLRLIPLAARAAERVARSGRGIVGALGSRELSRRPRAYARSALLLVLAIAIGIFAAAYARTWHRSQVDQAAYAAGADVLVQPGQSPDTAVEAGLGPSLVALGARAALPSLTDSFDLGAGDSGSLLALDARRLPEIVHVRSDFAAQPLRAALQPLAGARGRLASLTLPGRPLRLALTMALRLSLVPHQVRISGAANFPIGRPLPPPTLFLVVGDRAGLLYVYRLGTVPTNGRPQHFVVDLTRGFGGGPPRANYPLRLVAIDMNTIASPLASRRGVLSLQGLRSADGGGWHAVPVTKEQGWQGETTGLRAAYRAPRVGPAEVGSGRVAVPLQTGQRTLFGGPVVSTDFFIRPGRDVLPQALPVLASTTFLRAAGATVGQTLQLSLSQTTMTVSITGSFRHFPTLDPSVPAVIADLPTYLARSFHDGATVVQPDHWWLALGPAGAGAANRLRAPPWSSIEVTSVAERERALLDDPVALGVIGALALGFVVAAAFAGLGFAVSAAASARTRTLEFAVMRALGLRTRELSGWIVLEHALMVAFSVAGGTALGLAVSWLVLPYVSLGAAGAAPVPPVRVEMPWTTVLWLELGMLAALAAIAAAQVRLVRRLRPAPALRRSEGAVAP